MNNAKVKNIMAAAVVAVTVYLGLSAVERAVPVALAQGDQYLSRRIDMVEQRFYSLESRLNRVEQEQTRPAISPPVFSTQDTEITLLRSQVESLRMRLGEAECALLKLDERTLSPAAKQARAKARAAGTDKCRQDASKPVELSARP
jgi:hypothetical protein